MSNLEELLVIDKNVFADLGMELQLPDVWYTFEVDGGRYRTEKMDQQDAFQILTMQEQLWNFLFNNISAPPSTVGSDVTLRKNGVSFV